MTGMSALASRVRTMAGVVILCAMAVPASAQLTQDQKIHDFESIASLYAKRYAPYEWKKRLLEFDALAIEPWVDRIRHTTDDLGFFEILLEYVASLDDTHSSYAMPSTFVADLGLTVDIFDGRVLIETINRARLPLALFPFEVGDALVSVDGRSSESLIREFSRFLKRGNPVATRRTVADFLTRRPQSRIPRAVDLGDTAVVVIERQQGHVETYLLPWLKTGAPVRWVGAVPSPQRYQSFSAPASIATDTPAYLEPWLELSNFRLPSNDPLLSGQTTTEDGEAAARRYVLGIGSRTPAFVGGLPANFVQRLGRVAADFHFSGIYEAEGKRIGVLRFPSFSPPATALPELRAEIAYLEANTDGLVVDVMRNPGGSCYMFDAAALLIPHPFFFFGEEVRVTYSRLATIQAQLEAAQRANVPALVELYTEWQRQLEEAYYANRGMTGPLPVCSTQLYDNAPAKDTAGNVIAYSKPIIVLVDEFSISAADIFPAMLQDNERGPLVGTRTNGAGGSVSSWPAGNFSESVVGNTNTLVRRIAPVKVPGYPKAPYIENIGAHAEVRLDYMTRENLLNRGRSFVERFTRVIAAHIRGEDLEPLGDERERRDGPTRPREWTPGESRRESPSPLVTAAATGD